MVVIASTVKKCWLSESGDLLKYDTATLEPIKKIQYKLLTGNPETASNADYVTGYNREYDPDDSNNDYYYADIQNSDFDRKLQYIVTNNNTNSDAGTYTPPSSNSGKLEGIELKIEDGKGKTRSYTRKTSGYTDKLVWWISPTDENWQAGVDGYSPENFRLYQNYPNPFNPTTNIAFDIPASGHIDIAIHNLNGQRIRTLTNAVYDQGHHILTWDGTNDSGENVTSGVYLYIVQTPNYHSAKKLVFIQ